MSILRTSKNLTNVRNGGTPVIIRDAMFITNDMHMDDEAADEAAE